MIVEVAPEGEVLIGAVGLARVIQRVRLIMTTVKGTVPLDRDFGVDAAPLDQSLASAQALVASDIVEAVEANEPMVKVLAVDFRDDGRSGEGVLRPVVRLAVDEEAYVA